MKKGFTLVELIAVIVILAIIALFSFRSILGVRNDASEAALQTKVKSIEKQAALYAQDKKSFFSDTDKPNCDAASYTLLNNTLTYCNKICKDGKDNYINSIIEKINRECTDSNTTSFCNKYKNNQDAARNDYSKKWEDDCKIPTTTKCKVITVGELVNNGYYDNKNVKDDYNNVYMTDEKILVYRKNNRIYAKMQSDKYTKEEYKECTDNNETN